MSWRGVSDAAADCSGGGEREDVGIVISPSGIDEFTVLLTKEGALQRGSYCMFEHPVRRGVLCLARIFDGEANNPDMLPLSFGPILVKSGVELGREKEVVLLKAEFLGYIDGGFKSADYPPLPGQKVYEASADDVRAFYTSAEGIQLTLGRDPHSGLDLSFSVDAMTKGHVAVCGMTRSGKTTFVLNLIARGVERGCHFLVIDRTAEYIQPLSDVGARVAVRMPEDFKALSSMDAAKVASFLRLDAKSRKTDARVVEVVHSRVRRVVAGELTPEELCDVASVWEECVEGERRSDMRERMLRLLEEREALLRRLAEMKTEPDSVVDLVRDHKITLLDLSKERDIGSQQLAIYNVLRPLFDHAVATQGEDLTCMVVVEEAQFYAPERSAITYGEHWKLSTEILTACLSQLGGFNVGFIIITQRPAYVSKALLSQCNTFVIFRLMSGADHEQIASVTGYPRYRISKLLSGLPDHTAYVIGMASPFNFPTFIETVKENRKYPRKATLTPSQVIERMRAAALERRPPSGG